jgi:plasmid stabilization system protein ParE
LRRAIFLASVRADLVAIQTCIARESGSRSVASSFTSRLRQRCHQLAALPALIGRARPELGPGIRSSGFKGYVVFFPYRDDQLEVVNILEGHRDIDQHVDPSGSERPPSISHAGYEGA